MTDFTAHNEEQRSVWESFHAGAPIRMPMMIGYNPRMFLLDPQYSRGITFEQYYNDPEIMLNVQLYGHDIFRHQLYQDWEMGDLPSYSLFVDFQNDFECGQLGAQVRFSENNVPFTVPFLHEDNKCELFEKGIPDPFANLSQKAWDYRDYMQQRIDRGLTFKGRPVSGVGIPGLGTDGPMTLACMLRGTADFCIDLYEDEDYAQQLLSYLTETAILRIKAFRRRLGQPERSDGFFFADDSILLLSTEDYRRLILPHHKRLLRELVECDDTGRPLQPIGIHLCGDATRHFKTIRDELNCYTFDTGFPVQHGKLVQELGPEVTLQGGVHVDLLQRGTPEQVFAETRRIIEEVKPHTKRFIMRDANNLAPRTPMANIRAMYEAVREYGRYE